MHSIAPVEYQKPFNQITIRDGADRPFPVTMTPALQGA